MNYPYDKKILLRLCVIAGLIIFCVVYPSDDATSTDSSASSEAQQPWKQDIGELESEVSRVSSGPTNLENQRINAEKQAWWKLINDADQKAYLAQNPEQKEAFARLAQEIRDEFENIEDLLPERQEDSEEE